MSKAFTAWAVAIAAIGTFTIPSQAAGIKLSNDDGYIKLGGRIQLQYHMEDPSDGESEDDLFLRRFRPYIEGSIHEDWKGKFQWDMGKGSVEVKDAYARYSGFDWGNITIGNAAVPYSRERSTSSKKQQLVERTFAGDHNYGIPDRSTGIHLGGGTGNLTWNASGVIASHDPDNKKMDFDSPVSLNKGSDWSDGPMLGGRVEYAVLGGPQKLEQTDFKNSDPKLSVGLGAFTWSNDDDNIQSLSSDDDGNPSLGKQSLDSAVGLVVGASARYAGFSGDLEYNITNGELVDDVTSGLYEDGETDLESVSAEVGYLIPNSNAEVIYGFESLDADNYSDSWDRNSVGLNYYFKQHDIKLSTTYRMGENKDGKSGKDLDELFVQMQYVF